MNNRMPEDAEKVPTSSNDFFRLEEGDNKFRVLSNPIVGYETWIEDENGKKPVRSKDKLAVEPKNISIGKYGTQFNRYFRAFIAWDYSDNSIKLFQLDKKGVLSDIQNYLTDEDKANPQDYDMIITKSGSGDKTEYSLRVKDNKKLDKDIQSEWDKLKEFVKLDGHFEGEYILKKAREEQDSQMPF